MPSAESHERNWVHDEIPHALPLGESHIHPTNAPHAVSSSLPTWDAVLSWTRKEKAARENIEYSYPRFFINKPIQNLVVLVKERLELSHDQVSCLVFPSVKIANYCASVLLAKSPEATVHAIQFYLPDESTLNDQDNTWTDFSVVVFPADLTKAAMNLWMDTGAGMTTRHAEFCLGKFALLASKSSVPSLQSRAPRQRSAKCRTTNEWTLSGPKDKQVLQARIAELVTSENAELRRVTPEDVFIFPTGMNAIYSAFEALAAVNPNSDVIAYGWLYPETVHNLDRTAWNQVISFKWGADEELDQLERMLMDPKHRITTLVCEAPSNVKLISPNLEKIRSLADKHNLIVACDETVGNFINIDVLPYVDVVLSSLTKMFSGASDVTGGSVAINPNSPHYGKIRTQLAIQYGSVICFPPDLAVLKRNSINLASRVHKSNANTLPVIDLLRHHPSVQQVNHPSLKPASPCYEQIKRRNGGHGNVLSVVFQLPDSAIIFYDSLDVCKGSSFGTNFTVAVPYAQLACYWTQDKCEKYGLPKHIIRISVGLEDSKEICAKIAAALHVVEVAEGQSV